MGSIDATKEFSRTRAAEFARTTLGLTPDELQAAVLESQAKRRILT
jgi:hypothetical protein